MPAQKSDFWGVVELNSVQAEGEHSGNRGATAGTIHRKGGDWVLKGQRLRE